VSTLRNGLTSWKQKNGQSGVAPNKSKKKRMRKGVEKKVFLKDQISRVGVLRIGKEIKREYESSQMGKGEGKKSLRGEEKARPG